MRCHYLKGRIHNNRSLQHSSFITNSFNDYFTHAKDRQSLFFFKSEQYQVWKFVSPGYVILNRLRKVQLGRLSEPHDI
jgi:hypothetical protein